MTPCRNSLISMLCDCLVIHCFVSGSMLLLQTEANGPHTLDGRFLSGGRDRDPNVKVIASPWGEVGNIPYMHDDWPGDWGVLFNATFETYLNKLVGVEHNITFKMQFIGYSDLLHAIDKGAVDMIFLDAAKFSCSDRNNNFQSLATMRTREFVGRERYDTGHFHGAMIVRADSNITKVEHVRDKIIELTSADDLRGCQLQWDELKHHNVMLHSDIKQMRLVGEHNYARILQDVASGEVDVGFVAAGTLQTAEFKGVVEPGVLRVLGNLQGSTSDPFYPFPFTTRSYAPNWGLGALPWMEYELRDAVAKALLAMPSTHEAAAAGQYAGWQVALPYLGVREVHAHINWIDETTLQCHDSSSFCNSFNCPENHVAIGCNAIFESCVADQLFCPEDVYCLCRLCEQVPADEFIVWPVHEIPESSSSDAALGNDPENRNSTSVLERRCHKMTKCISAEKNHEIHIQVTDEWFNLRPHLGIPFVDYMEFNVHVGRFESDQWTAAAPVMEGDFARAFDIRFDAQQAGQNLVHIRACRSSTTKIVDLEEPECTELASSPTIAEVTTLVCPDSATRLSDDGRECVCLEEYRLDPDGECILKVKYDLWRHVQIFLGLIAGLVAALSVMGYNCLNHRQTESTWRIEYSALTFADPPEVLGQGSSGQVLKAEYRGTEVAVKRPFASTEERPSTQAKLPVFSDLGGLSPDDSQKASAAPAPVSAGINRLSDTQDVARGRQEHDQYVTPANDAHSPFEVQEILPGTAEEHLMETPVALDRVGKVELTATHDTKVGDVHMDENDQDRGVETHAIHDLPSKDNVAETVVGIDQMKSETKPIHEGDPLHPRDSLSTESRRSFLTWTPWKPWTLCLRNFGIHFNNEIYVESANHGTMSLRTAFTKQIQVMMNLRHPNIITVMGTVVDYGQEPLMVMECMSQGNLQSLLQNTTMHLDSDIVTKILEGLVSGLMFLHAAHPPVLHMDLKSSNVLLSRSFTPKLTDIGIVFSCKAGYFGTPFWMAPELFLEDAQPTMETDVFAFGMTVYEIFTRQDPYEGQDLVDILKRLKSGTEPDLRPLIPEAMPAELKELIVQCWHTDPALRLKLPAAKKLIANLPRDELDQWLATVEGQFKKTLSMCAAGQQKSAAQLLQEVFPPNIARTLREGKKVEPEHHECVTIFFSDIVGFTDISGTFKPLQVMNMLDRLYYEFDVAARTHDVFKVETIGDAYMAVANLVKEQPDHTKRIAKFAIDAIKTANRTPLDSDRPELGCVNIRVGFHSGPVVASVVGNMNPRFCLFGDTVNTASRMESNSQKNRIHMSEAAAANLKEQASELEIECRGRIPIKGKGEMLTFWLKFPTANAN